MKNKKSKKILDLLRRKVRIRAKISGTSDRPRLSVFRSNKHIYAQLTDDQKSCTLCSASDIKINKGKKTEKAAQVGEQIAELALKKKLNSCVFDRAGYAYHGRVKSLAEGARKKGLKF